MAGDHHSYEESIKKVYFGLALLAGVTVLEVLISLLGKGHLGLDVSGFKWLLIIVALGLIGLSLYKAYFIIYEFMHMKYEVKSLGASVLLPMLLLVWGIIAFFQDGNAWGTARAEIESRDRIENESSIQVLTSNTKEMKEVAPIPATDDHSHDNHGEDHDHGDHDH